MSLVTSASLSLSRRVATALLRPAVARAMSGEGHIRDDSSSTFAKKEKAQEEQYFRKEQQKAIGALKGQINEEIENHKKEIARHQEAIKRYEEKVKNLDKGSK